MRVTAGVPALLMLALPSIAAAQAQGCAVPASVPRPHADLPTPENPRRIMPIAHYTLALSWSPNYCHGKETSERDAFQCGGANGRFGFTLHGLWPDGDGGSWPQYCRSTALVPEAVIREALCSTPSAQLVQHEWAKHGTCMSPSPRAYFRRSTALYGKLRFPDMAALAHRDGVTAGEIAAAFAARNPGMRANMIRVTATKSGWLDELWLCLNTRMRYAACRPNTGGAPASMRLKISDPA